jgi:hypothetical protein
MNRTTLKFLALSRTVTISPQSRLRGNPSGNRLWPAPDAKPAIARHSSAMGSGATAVLALAAQNRGSPLRFEKSRLRIV